MTTAALATPFKPTALTNFRKIVFVGAPAPTQPTSPTSPTSPAPKPTPTPGPTPTPTPKPTPPPPPTPPVFYGGPVPEAILSNFSVPDLLQPAWGSGKVPADNGNDPVGAFRIICKPSHVGYDDPIVHPGQPGKSHLHQFFGNTKTDAFSTYQSLRTTGEGSCNNKLNRSAYWIPAMLDGVGGVVQPDFVSIYYKRLPKDSPKCDWTKDKKGEGKACVGLPRGLRFVRGYRMATMSDPESWSHYFDCQGKGAKSGHYKNLDLALQNCPVGAQVGAVVFAAPCWDGKRLDSADHMSHLADGSYGSWGYYKCPASHPYVIPSFTLGAWYTVDKNTDTWKLSSDMAGMIRGASLHMDWFGAWDDGVLAAFEDNCIDKHRNGSGGDLCNGKQLKPTFPQTVKHVVPVPTRPGN